MDCCGIKEEICACGFAMAQKFGFTFIGGHPMAGRECWGFESAKATLFDGASMIITPHEEEDEVLVARVSEFFPLKTSSSKTGISPLGKRNFCQESKIAMAWRKSSDDVSNEPFTAKERSKGAIGVCCILSMPHFFMLSQRRSHALVIFCPHQPHS